MSRSDVHNQQRVLGHNVTASDETLGHHLQKPYDESTLVITAYGKFQFSIQIFPSCWFWPRLTPEWLPALPLAPSGAILSAIRLPIDPEVRLQPVNVIIASEVHSRKRWDSARDSRNMQSRRSKSSMFSIINDVTYNNLLCWKEKTLLEILSRHDMGLFAKVRNMLIAGASDDNSRMSVMTVELYLAGKRKEGLTRGQYGGLGEESGEGSDRHDGAPGGAAALQWAGGLQGAQADGLQEVCKAAYGLGHHTWQSTHTWALCDLSRGKPHQTQLHAAIKSRWTLKGRR